MPLNFKPIVVVLMLVVLGSAWYWNSYKPAITNGGYEATTDPVDTIGWKIYRNEKYGFETRYPADFSVTEGFDEYWKFSYTTFEPLKENGILGKISISYNGPDWPSDPQGLGSRRFLGKVVVGGVEGSHYVIPFGVGEVHNVFVYFQPKEIKFNVNAQWGWIYDIPSPYNRAYNEDQKVIMDAFNQILAAFKFTAQP